MKKLILLGCFLLLALGPLACDKFYKLPPLPVVPATATPTSTPTYVSTPGCGFSSVTVPVPIYPYLTPTPGPSTPVTTPIGSTVPGKIYVIRNLSDWQAYYGSTTAPPPPVDFSTQMLIINLQAGTMLFPPDWINVQSVCWDNSKITVSCRLTYPCTGGGIIIYPVIWGTPTPGPTPTPTPPLWYYSATAIVVPLSSLPSDWIVTSIGIMPCPA